VHAKSTGELISFGFSNCSVQSLVLAITLSKSLIPSGKNDFNFWLLFGLSLNLGLSERLIQNVK